MTTKPDVQTAIAYIEEARQSHVAWADYLESDPDAGQTLEAEVETAGDVTHHRMWIDRYDVVLGALRRGGRK